MKHEEIKNQILQSLKGLSLNDARAVVYDVQEHISHLSHQATVNTFL